MNHLSHAYLLWKMKPEGRYFKGFPTRLDGAWQALACYRSAIGAMKQALGDEGRAAQHYVEAMFWWNEFASRRKDARLKV